MAVRQPTVEEIFRIADAYNLNPWPADVESYIELSQPILGSYARLDQLTAPSLPVKYPRSPGVRPQPEDNPLGTGTGAVPERLCLVDTAGKVGYCGGPAPFLRPGRMEAGNPGWCLFPVRLPVDQRRAGLPGCARPSGDISP